ncbi:MAG TPA: NAD(+) diphosphatase [Alphaproteobacteria bacterium]|nr:NAD(+) diphosphatase [Alphaproteobacteria bacterium]
MKSPNFYADLGLDRRAARRRDTAWLAARLLSPSACVVPVWRTRSFIRPGDKPTAVFLPPAAIETSVETAIFLGENGETAYFAVDVSMLAEDDLPRFAEGVGSFVDLRAVGPIIDRREGALLAYARGLIHWHSRHQYCGVCGSLTRSEAGGHVRTCVNPSCGAQHFPRTDPAVIMLVTHEDRCFLGRQKIWPPGMRSTLAGFVEPGESLEEAVAREVYEEAGIACLDVRYHSSQPWPFPSSIMLGFTARAATLDYRIDPDELETGAWYSREFLRRTHDPEQFRLPRLDSIARRLIEDWLAQT